MTKLSNLFNFLKIKLKVLGVRGFIFLLSLTVLTKEVHAKMMTKKCVSNEECGEDCVCSEGICHSCLNCGLLFREGPSCVMDFSECGSCREGYKDLPVTHFSSVMKPCEKIENEAYSQECLKDSDCLFDSYCHEKSCVKCFDCSLYNRLSPTRNCAKEPHDCSSCLNGFYEVPVTTETITKPCQKMIFHSSQNTNVIQFFNSSSSIALILMGVMEVGLVIALIYKIRAGRSKQTITLQHHSQRPPPYPSHTNTCEYAHELESEVEEESSFYTFVEEEKQHLNTAKIFRLPQASYYYESQDGNNDLFENISEDEEEDLNTDVVDPGIHRQSNPPLFSNNTEAEYLGACSLEVNDFEVVNEPEINNMMTESTDAVEECSSTLEESKNRNEGEGVEQKGKEEEGKATE